MWGNLTLWNVIGMIFMPGQPTLYPPNAPKPLGKGVTLRLFVDSNHAGDKVSRHSRTGFVIFLNHGMIDWLLKKQSTIEASVFGAEFCYETRH
jgi:hypothetical protein